MKQQWFLYLLWHLFHCRQFEPKISLFGLITCSDSCILGQHHVQWSEPDEVMNWIHTTCFSQQKFPTWDFISLTILFFTRVFILNAHTHTPTSINWSSQLCGRTRFLFSPNLQRMNLCYTFQALTYFLRTPLKCSFPRHRGRTTVTRSFFLFPNCAHFSENSGYAEWLHRKRLIDSNYKQARGLVLVCGQTVNKKKEIKDGVETNNEAFEEKTFVHVVRTQLLKIRKHLQEYFT